MKNSVKSAIVACGLVGSISYNPDVEINYLEDDSLFAKTATQLIVGWEWGVNYAHADGGGWGGISIGTSPGTGGGWGGGHGCSGDASECAENSTGGSGGNRNTEERIRKYRECRDDVSADKADCYSFSNNASALIGISCAATFRRPGFVALCSTLALGLNNYSTGICDDVAERGNQKCERDYG